MSAAGCLPDFCAPGATPEADVKEALLREQYRSLARLGPYVHAVVILAAIALCAAIGPTPSILGGIVLPAILASLSLIQLASWRRARSRVELETQAVVRREVRKAIFAGPAMALGLSLMAAVSAWQRNVVEFSLALAAVWVAVAACAFCLSALANSASAMVTAATGPLIVALLTRGTDLTFWLAALLTIGSCLVVPMLGENFRMFAEIVRSRFAIAEMQRAAERAREAAMTIALTDDLTGLPNRRCFQGLLADRMRRGLDGAEPFAVGFVDLDAFKPINDAYGHPVGDAILRQVADRLGTAMNGRGSAARMGGDEFAILCDRIGGRGQAMALGEEIQAVFAAPFAVEGVDIALTGACGFALFPSSAAEPDALVRLADAALYRAKAIGRGGVAVFGPEAESDAVDRAPLDETLRRGDAGLGPIAPRAFLPAAAQIRGIGDLPEAGLRRAARTAARWPGDLSLSFDLSAAQAPTPTSGLRVAAAFGEFGPSPIRFGVEAPEAAAMTAIGAQGFDWRQQLDQAGRAGAM